MSIKKLRLDARQFFAEVETIQTGYRENLDPNHSKIYIRKISAGNFSNILISLVSGMAQPG